ncbi:coenzyme F420-0:L-glutamate ligase [Cellulomonas sp. KRMCY2]|uniref:coenzyme F420-0:L-glutamate ligase n=1 Tax=Cellulomonas sp. KRMCY2 TaxID=1304865 RepID=UPI00045E9F8B|nr:coenzyme F420-0:L-glutamate ligase [Cellulomonas sp. KRMCY2]
MTEAIEPLVVIGLDGLPEVRPGDDLVALVGAAVQGLAWPDGSGGLADGDVVVVTSKVVSKAEGRVLTAADREQAITQETVRVVATRIHPAGVLRIVENRQGLVMAAAGVDASNTPEGTVLLLPADPDSSARGLRRGLQASSGVRIGVLVTDTAGRAWRQGLTDLAIGAAGVVVLEDLRGRSDSHGRRLDSTITAVADEIAAATELVTGKMTGRPVAVVRGMRRYVLALDDDGDGARSVVRPADEDLFAEGTAEAYARGLADGRGAGPISGRPSPLP